MRTQRRAMCHPQKCCKIDTVHSVHYTVFFCMEQKARDPPPTEAKVRPSSYLFFLSLSLSILTFGAVYRTFWSLNARHSAEFL